MLVEMEKVISVNPEQSLSESGSRQSRSRADGAAKNKGQVLGSTKISICLTKLFFVKIWNPKLPFLGIAENSAFLFTF